MPKPIELRRFQHHEALWRWGTADRNEEIARQHKLGASITELARIHTLSRPRIVQILNRVKFWSKQNV